MRIDLINNSGISSFSQELQQQMLKAKNFSIATAFITEEAISLLNLYLAKNKNKIGTARLLTGFYNCFNSKEVLQSLSELVIKSKGRLQVNISHNLKFHWKLYTFEYNEKTVVFIGSANFTRSGMNDQGELQTKLMLGRNDIGFTNNLKSTFNKVWENSISITKIPLKKYKQIKQPRTESSLLDPEIKKLLSKSKVASRIDSKRLPNRAVSIYGDLSAKTIKQVEEFKSKWQNDGVDYFSCFTKSEYDACLKAKTLLLIYRTRGESGFDIADIIDDCILRTSDGNYFIAHKPRGRFRKEKELYRNELESMGIMYHSRKFQNKNLGNNQAKRIMSILNYKY